MLFIHHSYQQNFTYLQTPKFNLYFNLTIFYSPQAPIKRVWNPLPPKIYKADPSLKTSLNQTWVFTVGQNEYNLFFGYMLINPSHDVVFILACYSYFKLVRWEGFKSMENDGEIIIHWRIWKMGMSHHRFFFKFSELKYKPKQVHFSSFQFFFIISMYDWCMREKNVLLGV